jgi:uncharacterized protein
MTTLMPGRGPLTDEELEQLGAFLHGLRNPDRLTLEGLDGFFCALIAGPDLVLPSEYLPVVWGGEMADEDAFESDEQVNELLGFLMRHWNAIVNEYETERVYVPLLDPADEHGVPGRQWARGFMRGVALRRRSWTPMFTDEREGQLMTIALVAGEVDPAWPAEPLPAETTERLDSLMIAGAGRAYHRFAGQRRADARQTREAKTVRREVPKVGAQRAVPVRVWKEVQAVLRSRRPVGTLSRGWLAG